MQNTISNWLLCYAITINVKSSSQKIIKSDRLDLVTIKNEPPDADPFKYENVSHFCSFSKISSFCEKGKGLWPRNRRNTIYCPNRSLDNSVQNDLEPILIQVQCQSVLDPFPSSDHRAQKEKGKKKEKGEKGKRNRPPGRSPLGVGIGNRQPPGSWVGPRRCHVANAKATSLSTLPGFLVEVDRWLITIRVRSVTHIWK